jgi:tetratricopeptide (TPR) repeat protein
MMARRRPRYWATAVTTLIVFVLSVPLALAINAASGLGRWPGWLDIVRRHPFWSVAVLAAVSLLVLAVAFWNQRRSQEPASADELAEVENRLQQRFDDAAVARTGLDDRLDRLPPYPRALIRESGADQAMIMKVVAPFTQDSVDPRVLAREWAASPPSVLNELPVIGRLVAAEILAAYEQPSAAIEQLRAAATLGATPRAYWLIRMAQLAWLVDGDDSARATDFLDQAKRVHSDYPLLRAIFLSRSGVWSEAEVALSGWSPSTVWERDIALTVLGGAMVEQQRLDHAITAMEAGTTETFNAALLLQLARLLRARSVRGGGDSRWQDAFRSVEVALRARNLRRSWRGDSAEAVAAAAEAAIIADNSGQVWSLTRPAPDGEATTCEAGDPRILPLAAMGAALTGRIAQAQDLVNQAPDGYVRKRVEAEIASAVSTNEPDATATAAWMAVYHAATTDEERLQALRGLAIEGATDRAALDDLRSQHPEAVADIETTFEVTSTTGPDADERLRMLESRTPLASLRRAELLRHEDPRLAAEVLADANARWRDPRLLLLAIDCYVDAGDWTQAEVLAQQALSDTGTLWPGRATVLRRMVSIQLGLLNWAKVETACRALLEIDPNDEEARWNLAFAQYRSGEPQDAWRTLNRATVAVEAITPNRAMFLLDLARRYTDAIRAAQTALAMLRAFPDNRYVHAAAINAVTTRTDRSDLPDDIGAEISTAWSSFIDRYAGTELLKAYTVGDGDNPLAELEPQLREEATTYQEILGMVQDQALPIGMLDRVVGKPYAAIFPYRPLGYHRAASPVPQDITIELEMARAAGTRTCLVDASALYTLALIPEFAQTLISLTQRPTTTDSALTDLVAADDHFSIPSSGTLAFDTGQGRIVADERDAEVTRRQQDQIRAMLATARGMRRVIHPSLIHLPSMDDRHEPVWLLNVDAAKNADAVLWADDIGLRRLAHSLGLKTFGTQSLLSVARERGRIDDVPYAAIVRALLAEYVVDLPFDSEALLAVAADEDWEPRAVATVLSRPASWANVAPAVAVFREAFRSAPDNKLTGWAYAALHGLNKASLPDHRHNNLVELTAATLGDDWTRPEHSSAFITALAAVDPDDADTIARAAIERVWKRMRDAYAVENAVIVFLHVISRLDESHRQYGMQLILAP